MVGDIILPKLLIHNKPIPLPFNDIISILKAQKFCTSKYTPNHPVWILFWIIILPQSSDSLLKTQAVYSSETLLPKQHILTKTVLFFFTTVKTWRKNFEKVWMVHAWNTEWKVQYYFLYQHSI